MSRYCDIKDHTGKCLDLYSISRILPVTTSDNGPYFYVDLDNGDRITISLIEPYSTISQLSDVHRRLVDDWEHFKECGF